MMAFLDDYDDGNTLSCSVLCSVQQQLTSYRSRLYIQHTGWVLLVALPPLAGWLLLLFKYKTSCARETDMGRSES